MQRFLLVECPDLTWTFWHTHRDNIDIIDRNTLKAIGQKVMSVVYEEPGL